MSIVLRPFPAGRTPDQQQQRLLGLTGRDAVVIGLGKSGVAAVKLLLKLGARAVTVLDDKPQDALGAVSAELSALGNVKVVGGGIDPTRAAGAELVVMSPGVPRRGAWWDAMVAAGTCWLGEAELAWRCTRGRWLAITGTNGKSTTTTMLGTLVKQHNPRTFVGGNLGTPACEAALSADRYDEFVMELSSYQCEGIVTLDATTAVLCNLSPDHLERYKVVDRYYDAKLNLFRAMSAGHTAVVNAVDAESMARTRDLTCARLDFGVKHGAPGVAIDDRARTLTLRHGRDVETYTLGNRAIRGRHNFENAAAAVASARAAGIPQDAVQRGLDVFEPVPHRLQEVGRINGALYVNDSKGTNVDATLKALMSFEEPIHLIAGGQDKGSSYEPLVHAAKGRVKACYVIGQAAPLIANALQSVCTVLDCGTMEKALERARDLAKPGEVVLLSPACASFDQFRNFEHRGQVFMDWVRARTGGAA
jgi:UDP-N-acetylmuramoylalanine--D-glutamate ligase